MLKTYEAILVPILHLKSLDIQNSNLARDLLGVAEIVNSVASEGCSVFFGPRFFRLEKMRRLHKTHHAGELLLAHTIREKRRLPRSSIFLITLKFCRVNKKRSLEYIANFLESINIILGI